MVQALEKIEGSRFKHRKNDGCHRISGVLTSRLLLLPATSSKLLQAVADVGEGHISEAGKWGKGIGRALDNARVVFLAIF